MGKLSVEEFEMQLADIPVEKPDEWDLQMLSEIKAETDNSTITLEEMRRLRGRNASLAQQIGAMVEHLPEKKQSLVYELVATLMA